MHFYINSYIFCEHKQEFNPFIQPIGAVPLLYEKDSKTIIKKSTF